MPYTSPLLQRGIQLEHATLDWNVLLGLNASWAGEADGVVGPLLAGYCLWEARHAWHETGTL